MDNKEDFSMQDILIMQGNSGLEYQISSSDEEGIIFKEILKPKKRSYETTNNTDKDTLKVVFIPLASLLLVPVSVLNTGRYTDRYIGKYKETKQ